MFHPAPHASFEAAFSCRVLQWAEPTDDEGRVQFTVLDARGRLIIADSVELLALELTPAAPYRMAA